MVALYTELVQEAKLKDYLAGAAVRPLLLVRFAAFQQGSIFYLPQFRAWCKIHSLKMEMKTSCQIFQLQLHRCDIYRFLFSLGLCLTESRQYRFKGTDNDTHKDEDKKTMTMLTNAPVAVLAPIKVDSLLLVDKMITHI